MDLPGPKYRTGKLKGGRATLEQGANVTITINDVEGDETLVPVNLPTYLSEIGEKQNAVRQYYRPSR